MVPVIGPFLVSCVRSPFFGLGSHCTHLGRVSQLQPPLVTISAAVCSRGSRVWRVGCMPEALP